MIKSIISISSVIFCLTLSYFTTNKDIQQTWGKDTPVREVLKNLGVSIPDHGVPNPTAEQIQMGKDLMLNGITSGGQLSSKKLVSKHFVCTHCHNMVQEDPDFKVADPEARLTYAMNKNLPFLQGTTMYGAVNRKSWYNDDYIKKYGSLVEAASGDLRESIQLCAVECSQGRKLTDWELDAVVAYLWSLELKLGDLNLTQADYQRLIAAGDGTDKEKKATADWLEKQYFVASPATFGNSWESREKCKDLKGDPKRGKAIYHLSCQHCHADDALLTNFPLDNSKMTFKLLKRHAKKWDSHYSIYYISRTGTKPMMGYKPYMPHYTMERMSDQQLADLQAFIQEETN